MKLNLSNLESFIHNLKFLPNTWPKLSFLLRGIYHNHKNYKYKESKIGNRRKAKFVLKPKNMKIPVVLVIGGSEVLFDQICENYFNFFKGGKKTLHKDFGFG